MSFRIGCGNGNACLLCGRKACRSVAGPVRRGILQKDSEPRGATGTSYGFRRWTVSGSSDRCAHLRTPDAAGDRGCPVYLRQYRGPKGREEIFGAWPRIIEISSNNTVRYYVYPNSISAETRKGYYTDAEVLFGFHTIISWNWSDFIKTFLEGIFNWVMEDSVIGTATQAYRTLFHAGGILHECSSKASEYAEDYLKENIEKDVEKKLGKKAKDCFSWTLNMVLILADSTFSAFNIPNPKDLTIYRRISDIPDYLTIIDEYNGNVSMEELIELCNLNQ